MPMTRSPASKPVTPGPTSVMTPAPSLPMECSPGYMSSAMSTSRKFSPAARTDTRTWPGSSGSRTSGQGSRARFSSVPGFVVPSRQAPAPDGGVSSSPVFTRTSRGSSTVPSRTAS